MYQNFITTQRKNENVNMVSKENNYVVVPKMMTVRQVAATGILPEAAIRRLLKEKKIAAVYSGSKAFINFEILCKQLANLEPAV